MQLLAPQNKVFADWRPQQAQARGAADVEHPQALVSITGFLAIAGVAFLSSLIVNALAKRRIANPSKVTFTAIGAIGLVALGLAAARSSFLFGYELGQLLIALTVLGIIHHFATRKRSSDSSAANQSKPTDQNPEATGGGKPPVASA